MKEKIIKILKSHSYHHTEGVGVKSQFKYLAEIAFECCADEIMLALDQSKFTADEAEEHINQEVEKRIKERMPSEEEIDSAAYHYGQFPDLDGMMIHDGEAQVTFAEGAEWLRSRLTTPGVNDSQKTEGGGK